MATRHTWPCSPLQEDSLKKPPHQNEALSCEAEEKYFKNVAKIFTKLDTSGVFRRRQRVPSDRALGPLRPQHLHEVLFH